MLRLVTIAFLALVACLSQTSPAQGDDEAEIRKLEHAWDMANLKGDADSLARILADTFIMTGADGKVHTKSEMITELRSRRIAYQTAKTEELKIILHGDAAVASGRWRGSYTNRGIKVNLLERFTNFYVLRNGRWQCVASHGSAIEP